MDEPQVWTIIGIFAATMASVVTLTVTTIRAMIGRLEVKVDALDRDLGAITKQLLGFDRK